MRDDKPAAPQPGAVPTYQDIVQAVARGWCHKATEKKTMDPVLAFAIANEVFKVMPRAIVVENKPAADHAALLRECVTFLDELDTVRNLDGTPAPIDFKADALLSACRDALRSRPLWAATTGG